MTEDKEAEMRLQGIEFWGQRKGKWQRNTSLKKVPEGKERIPFWPLLLINQKYNMTSNKYSRLTVQSFLHSHRKVNAVRLGVLVKLYHLNKKCSVFIDWYVVRM